MVGTHTDITGRKRAEEELRESGQKYRRLIETTGTGYVILDHQGRVTDANQEYAQLTGRQRLEDVVGHGVLEWTAPQNIERNAAEVRKCVEHGFVRNPEIDYITPTGQVVPIEINATVLSAPGTLQILTICRDITERKRAEEALRESEVALQERVKELNCLYGISALLELPGITLDEILKSTFMLIPPAWQFPEITAACIAVDGQSFQTENFRETPWMQTSEIIVHGKPVGQLEIHYLEERPASNEGPFLIEERHLLNSIAERLGSVVERVRSEQALQTAHWQVQDIIEFLPDATFVIDRDKKVIA
jgi:PAS domain S-box-containing protein